MKRCSLCRQPGHKRAGCLMGLGYTEEDIVRMYVDEEMSVKDIAFRVGFDTNHVRIAGILREQNVVMRERGGKGKPHRRVFMTRSQYDSVKQSRGHGLGSQEVAAYLGVELEEVNAAWGATGYEGYLSGKI